MRTDEEIFSKLLGMLLDNTKISIDYMHNFFDLQDKVNSLYDAIKHGDDEHREWLKKKIEDHFNA